MIKDDKDAMSVLLDCSHLQIAQIIGGVRLYGAQFVAHEVQLLKLGKACHQLYKPGTASHGQQCEWSDTQAWGAGWTNQENSISQNMFQHRGRSPLDNVSG